MNENDIKKAFMTYLEAALVKFEEPHGELTNAERIDIYYNAFKDTVSDLYKNLISELRLAGNIQTDNPETVMALAVKMIWRESRKEKES